MIKLTIHRLWASLLLAPLALGGLVSVAFANPESAQPWQMGLRPAASPTMEMIHDFHTILLWMCVLITIFVLILLVYVIWRFSEKNNPVPSKTSHNTPLEVIWTALPILILVVLAVPSFKLLYFADHTQDVDMTLKITGHQWYWSYSYPDHGDFGYDSYMVAKEDLKPGQPRLLQVDNPVVLPVDTNVRLLMTSDDVIHNWAMPNFGIKLDTVPGRTNETWVRATREGTYYGMCSELCGVNHGFMPITVHVVSAREFEAWTQQAKEEFAANDGKLQTTPRIAAIKDRLNAIAVNEQDLPRAE